jgi:hypothetical protein
MIAGSAAPVAGGPAQPLARGSGPRWPQPMGCTVCVHNGQLAVLYCSVVHAGMHVCCVGQLNSVSVESLYDHVCTQRHGVDMRKTPTQGPGCDTGCHQLVLQLWPAAAAGGQKHLLLASTCIAMAHSVMLFNRAIQVVQLHSITVQVASSHLHSFQYHFSLESKLRRLPAPFTQMVHLVACRVQKPLTPAGTTTDLCGAPCSTAQSLCTVRTRSTCMCSKLPHDGDRSMQAVTQLPAT